MIQSLYNLLHWPLFWWRRKKEEVAPEDKIEVAEGVSFGLFDKEERKSCAILDTADRLASLLGKPALKVYLEVVKTHELWTHSEADTVSEIYQAGYVNPALAMWTALRGDLTGIAPIPPPLPDAYVTPELIFPELFRISAGARDVIITGAPWCIYVYDWQEFLAKKATYWYYGSANCGAVYRAWKELEQARGRTQPDIAGLFLENDRMIGWVSPRLWFVGKFDLGNTSQMWDQVPGAEASIRVEMVALLCMIRFARGLSVSWDGPFAFYDVLFYKLRAYGYENWDLWWMWKRGW